MRVMNNKELFIKDLKNLLIITEKLALYNEDHINYVKAYKDFIDTWAPKLNCNDNKEK